MVHMLFGVVMLIVPATVALLRCNPEEDVPIRIQTVVSENRTGLVDLPSLDLQEKSPEMSTARTIPLIQSAGDLHCATQLVHTGGRGGITQGVN